MSDDTPITRWADPVTGATATVQQYPPSLHPDTWCVTFMTPDGRPNGGANLEAAWVGPTMVNKGFVPAAEAEAFAVAAGIAAAPDAAQLQAVVAALRAFPTAAEAVARPELAMPKPRAQAKAPTLAKVLKRGGR